MLTPSGRFEAGAKICLSLSDFHPETWNPLWGVSHILLGLQSFFYENTSTTGALHGVPANEKRRLAAQSLAFNVRNATFRRLFPELVEKHAEQQAEAEAAKALQQHAAKTSSPAVQTAAAAEQPNHAELVRNAPAGHADGRWREMSLLVCVAVMAVVVGIASVSY
jgi:ubiquitin-conjugating enzyme E2 J2